MDGGVEISGQRRPIQSGIRRLLIAVSIIAVLLAVFVFIRGARESARQTMCANHLKLIGVALQNYHDTFQSFPAAWQVDGTGKPARSWRLAIGPFTDSASYRYDDSEPWNGPSNSRLASGMPFWLRCPSNHLHNSKMTSYVAVVGPGTAWPGTGYSSMRDLKDGASNTIMVVEISNSDIHWMEPRDLAIEELAEWLKPSHKPALGSSHRIGQFTGCMAVFADAHVEYLPRSKMTEKRLRALLSPAGNDAADAEE